MDDMTRSLQEAAARMQQSGEALGAAHDHLLLLQARHDATVKKIADLARLLATSPESGTRAALAKQSARQDGQQRALAKQQAALDTARRTFEAHRRNFERLGALYQDRLTHAPRLQHRQDRRERALIRVFERMIAGLYARAAQRDSDFRLSQDSHGYVALDAARFVDLLMDLDALLSVDPDYAAAAGRYRPVSFLEIGCGQGRNMVLAQNARILSIERIRGFDIDAAMVAGGRDAFGFGTDIFVADALEADYGGHDVIYSFRPFSNMELQARLEERISRTMDKGAYYLGPFSFDMARYPGMRRMGPELEIWKKTAETGEA